MELPKFQEGTNNGKCFKCNYIIQGVFDFYPATYCSGLSASCNINIDKEHIHVKCANCNYIWAEQCADA